MVANSAIQMVTTYAGPSWAVLVVYVIYLALSKISASREGALCMLSFLRILTHKVPPLLK
jgi:hypothetical protein